MKRRNGVEVTELAKAIWPNVTTVGGTFTGFTSAQAKTLNITGLIGNNPVVRQVRLWISNDPTADENIEFRLSFYNADSMTEDELLKDFDGFHLLYTETDGGAAATDTTDAVDNVFAGWLHEFDLVRYMGGTAENVRLTAEPQPDKKLTFTALAGQHADDTGVVLVHEINDMFQLYDADGSQEIHAKLEAKSAPTASMNVYMEVDLQT